MKLMIIIHQPSIRMLMILESLFFPNGWFMTLLGFQFMELTSKSLKVGFSLNHPAMGYRHWKPRHCSTHIGDAFPGTPDRRRRQRAPQGLQEFLGLLHLCPRVPQRLGFLDIGRGLNQPNLGRILALTWFLGGD